MLQGRPQSWGSISSSSKDRGDVHGHHAAQSLFTFLPLQPGLSACDADGGSAGDQGQQGAKILLGPQWDGEEKRGRGKGRRRDVALGIWAFDGENSCLCMLQGVQPCLGLSPAWITPHSSLGLVQCGSWVSRCSPAARKTFQCAWKALPRWAAVAGSEQPACWQGRSPSPEPPFSTAGPGSAFHSLEKSSNYLLQPYYPKHPAQLRQQLLWVGKLRHSAGEDFPAVIGTPSSRGVGESEATLGILLPPSWLQCGLFLAGRSWTGRDDSEAGGGEAGGPWQLKQDGKWDGGMKSMQWAGCCFHPDGCSRTSLGLIPAENAGSVG